MASSFDSAFEAEYAPLHGYLYRRLGSGLAEDLTAETFAIAYRRWNDLDPSRPVRPWLYGIAANLLRRHWRKERRMLRAYANSATAPLPSQEDETVDRSDAALLRRTLAAALAQLRPEDREVLLLRAWADFSDSDIAEALGLPIGTVKSRLHHAREEMENQVTRGGQVETGAPTTTTEG